MSSNYLEEEKRPPDVSGKVAPRLPDISGTQGAAPDISGTLPVGPPDALGNRTAAAPPPSLAPFLILLLSLVQCGALRFACLRASRPNTRFVTLLRRPERPV